MTHKKIKDEDKLKVISNEMQKHFEERIDYLKFIAKGFDAHKVSKDLVSIALMTLVKHDVI